MAAANVFLLVLVVVQARRLGGLRRRIDRLARGTDGASLEGVLGEHLGKVLDVGREVDELSARSAVLEANARRALQRIGLVRFNPFEDTGGNQSFAVALLDSHGDGFVLSSLHSRTGTRVYAKALANGRSEAALSGEEAEALRLALESGAPRTRAAS